MDAELRKKVEAARLAAAMSLVGIPFVEGGRHERDDGGLDCYGLVRRVLMLGGWSIPREQRGLMRCKGGVAVELSGAWSPVFGDVVYLPDGGAGIPHVMVAVSGFDMLHSVRDGEVVCQPLRLVPEDRRVFRVRPKLC